MNPANFAKFHDVFDSNNAYDLDYNLVFLQKLRRLPGIALLIAHRRKAEKQKPGQNLEVVIPQPL